MDNIIESKIGDDLKVRARRELRRCTTNQVATIVTALQLHSWINTPEETARLNAGLEVLKERSRNER
jgi:hypothetical protein